MGNPGHVDTHTIGTEFYRKCLQSVNFRTLCKLFFDECTLKFVNTMHSIQLEYRTEINKMLLVFVHICKYVLKSAMYVSEYRDLDFLWVYLAGLVLTLAVWYVT